MTYDKLIFGMHHLTITQAGAGMTGGKNLSHIDYELDLAGSDAGIDYYRNMMPNTCWKVAGKWGTSGTIFLHSCDAKGKAKKVLWADGVLRYTTLAMTHSYASYRIGSIIHFKDVLYQEGKNGFATGNHIHLEICEGLVTKKVAKGDVYILENMADPRKALWLLDGYTTVKADMGIKFKHTKSAEAVGWVQDAKGWWYLNKDGTYLKNGWHKLDEWYFFNKNGYAVHDRWNYHSDKKWYYLGSDCRMQRNKWIKWNQKWCYVCADGSAYTSCTVDIDGKSYTFDSKGYLI